MALLKLGGGVVEIRGSMAGNTFARNRFGAYMRARTKPINPRSSRQMAARTNIMYLAEQWRESPLTDVIRTAWQTYANSVVWNNKLGEAVSLTGFNMFMRANCALLTAGESMITAAPTDLGLPQADPTFAIGAVSAAAQTCSCVFDDTMPWCDEDGAFMLIHIGLPQNPSRNFFAGPWRYMTKIDGDSISPPASPEAAIPVTGYTAVETQKIWFKCHIIRADGRMTTQIYSAPAIVAA